MTFSLLDIATKLPINLIDVLKVMNTSLEDQNYHIARFLASKIPLLHLIAMIFAPYHKYPKNMLAQVKIPSICIDSLDSG